MMTRPGLRPRDTKSIADPGKPTLREAIDGMALNIQEAARLESEARQEAVGADLDSPKERQARGWESQSRAEKDHWRGYLTAYRIHADVHPELLDKPLGTRCSHGVDCLIGNPNARARPERDVGADDGDESPAYRPDPRLPPEPEPELPFDNP